jgi:predicted Zn-dependent protease
MRFQLACRLACLGACVTLFPACLGLGGADSSAYDPYNDVGSSAHDLLSEEKFKSITIEIQAIEGFVPSSQALEKLQSFLKSHVHKPEGVRIVLDSPLPPTGKSTLTSNQIRAIETQHRTHFSNGSEIVVYLLFADAGSTNDTPTFNTLGQAYWNTSIAIFESTIRKVAIQAAGSAQAYWSVEAIALTHEFGHLLGLVNDGTAPTTSHQDDSHGAHCSNPACLMHYSVHNGALADGFTTGQLPELDDDCLNDLRSNGGK